MFALLSSRLKFILSILFILSQIHPVIPSILSRTHPVHPVHPVSDTSCSSRPSCLKYILFILSILSQIHPVILSILSQIHPVIPSILSWLGVPLNSQAPHAAAAGNERDSRLYLGGAHCYIVPLNDPLKIAGGCDKIRTL